MPFVLYVAADLYSQKVNLEFELPSVPTVSELLSAVQATFSNESAALKPPTLALQTIRVTKLQVYKDEDGSWSDLTSPTQLSEFAQLYVFQAEPQYQESQQPIPPARRPSRPAPAPISPVSVQTPLRRPSSPQRTPIPTYSTLNLNGAAQRTPGSYGPRSEHIAFGSYSRASESQPQPRQVSPRRFGVQASMPSAVHASSVVQHPLGPASPQRDNLARAPIPEHPSQRDKIAYLYDEMDTNGNRVIEPEEFRALIRMLGVDFSNATLSELFQRGDLDRDGVLSLGEFTQLLTNYPTLLDATFFRLRDIQEARNLQKMMAEERAALDAAREQRSRSAAMASECARLVAEATLKIRESEAEAAHSASRAAELHHVMGQSTSDVEHGARLRLAAQVDVDAVRDKEASHAGALADAGHHVRESDSRLVAEQEHLRACQDKERQLQMLLLEAQKATERQQHIALEAQSELARRRDQEHQAAVHLAEVQREAQILFDRLGAAERELRLREERQKEIQALLSDATAVLTRVERRLDDERHDVAVCADREKSNRMLLNEAEASVLAAERRVASRDQDILTFNQRRASMEQQERPLLEQEIRLREARDSLDEREVKLRRDAVSYFDSSRIGNAATPSFGKALSPSRLR
jgi:hypothetical protein